MDRRTFLKVSTVLGSAAVLSPWIELATGDRASATYAKPIQEILVQ